MNLNLATTHQKLTALQIMNNKSIVQLSYYDKKKCNNSYYDKSNDHDSKEKS